MKLVTKGESSQVADPNPTENYPVCKKMQSVYASLIDIITEHSFGPCYATLCVFNDDLRAVHIRPFNYYLLNYKHRIIILNHSPITNTPSNAIILVYDEENKKPLLRFINSWTTSECYSRMNFQPKKSFLLFPKSAGITYIQIINSLLEHGIFKF